MSNPPESGGELRRSTPMDTSGGQKSASCRRLRSHGPGYQVDAARYMCVGRHVGSGHCLHHIAGAVPQIAACHDAELNITSAQADWVLYMVMSAHAASSAQAILLAQTITTPHDTGRWPMTCGCAWRPFWRWCPQWRPAAPWSPSTLGLRRPLCFRRPAAPCLMSLGGLMSCGAPLVHCGLMALW